MVLIAAYVVVAFCLHSAGVPPATPIGVLCGFLFCNVLLVHEEALYLVLAVPYAVSKCF